MSNLKELAINNYTNELAYSSSLEFDGTNDYVSSPATSDLNFTAPGFTIEAWIKPDTITGRKRIFGKAPSSGANGYTLAVRNGKLSFLLFGAGVNLETTGTYITAGNWQHVAMVFDSSQDALYYVNGILRETVAGSTNPVSSTASQAIGRSGELDVSGEYFDGLISDLRVWNVERSANEIKENRARRLRGDEAGLVAYYRLNEGSGTTAVDSANSNNGTLTNFPADPWSDSVAPVYQKTFKERYSEFVVSEFSSSINSGLGQATITIPKRLDNIGEAEQVGNEIEIIVYDNEAPSGILVYSGQVEEVQKISGSGEEIQLVAEGHIRGLADDFVQNYSNQFRFDLSSADLGTQFKTVLDYFNYHNPRSPITYDDADIATVGTSRIVNIDNQSYLDTLNQIREMAGADYYFYLGADNKMIFKTFNTSFDHIFTLEGDVAELDETTTISEVKNGLLFAGGSSNNRYYSDELSQFKYGRRIEQKKDERFTNTTSMDSFGNSFISIRKDPFDVVNLGVLDSNYDSSGFDIETVKPGDTLILNNTGRTESVQLITNLTYSISTIGLTTKDVRKFVEREVHELRERVERISYGGDGPQTYTNV